MTTENSNGRGRPSSRPITDRVFEQWQAATKSQARADEHAGKLASLSSKLDADEVKTVEKMIAEFKANPTATVEGKISVG